jgi:predicted permease
MSARYGVAARIARAIIARTVWESDAQDALANLDELYLERAASRGRFEAELWYLGQSLSFGPRLWLDPRGRRRGADRRERSLLAQWLDGFRADVRFALRGFRKTPAFTFAAVSTLAVGVAATTLIYSVVEGAVLTPPAFPEADELVWVWPSGDLALTHATYLELERQIESADLTAFASRSFALLSGERPDEIVGVAVTPDHFAVMGQPAALGRGLAPSDGDPGRGPIALISHELWTSRFGGDPEVVGRQIDLYTSAVIPMISGAFTGTRHTVVGVLPPAYRPFGARVDVVTPLVADAASNSFSEMGELSVIGRLRDGVSAGQLRAELVAAARTVPQLDSSLETIAAAEVVGLHEALTGQFRSALLVTLGAVGLVLLIACANVANLVLVRAESRRGELGVRTALGAARARIGRQLVTESGVLAVTATVVGVGAALLLLPLIIRLLPPDLGIPAEAIRVRGSILAVAAGVTSITLLVAGVLPAMRGTHGLAAGGERTRVGSSRRGRRAYHAFIVAELALAAVLASGAGLLIKSFSRLANVEPGFSAQNVLTARIAPSAEEYADADVRRALFARVLDEVRALPGVEAAGAIHFLPVADGGPGLNFLLDPADPESRASTGYRVVTPGYFEALGIQVAEGRDVRDLDGESGPRVGLVNRALAARLWPGESAIGKRLYRTAGQEWFTVVGVTEDVRQSALGVPAAPEAYVPLAQTQWASAMTVVLRANRLTPAIGREVERIIWAVDPRVPITRTASMEDVVSDSVATPRFYSTLFAMFALLALLLGSIGVYGVVSFGVRERTDEIGIRLALGASAPAILGAEIGRAARLSILGVGLGLIAAVGATRLLGSLLYEVSVFDPLVFAASAAVLVGVALASAFGPARRASRVDPLSSIRGE